METKNSKLVVVLGMHRSGTSAITRGLEVVGVQLGDSLHQADIDNPKGFWEDIDFLDINESLLAHIGSAYTRVGLIDRKIPNTREIESLRLKAEQLVREKCNKNIVWGFKDPRTARLLHFWQPIFEGVGCDVGYVIASRNPISVVESLRKHGFEPEMSFYLWLEHLIPALSETAGAKRVVVDYDQLLENPELELLRVAQALGLSKPEPLSLAVYKNDFLETGLRHTFFTPQDLGLYPSAPSQVVTAYEWLAKLANDEFSLDNPEVSRAFDAMSRELVVLSPALDLMARQEQIATCNHQVREIQRLEICVEEKQCVVEKLNEQINASNWQLNQVVEKLNEQINASNWQLNQVKAELQLTSSEYRALKQTRWFRLREVLLFHPLGIRKLLHIGALVVGAFFPRVLRSALMSHVNRLIRLARGPSATHAKNPAAYQVKLPPAPPQNAPKVVHVIANFMTGGSSRLVVDLVEYLGGSVQQVVLTSFNPLPPAYVGVKIDECPLSASIEPFVEYFKRTVPDFVHVHYWGDCDESWYAKTIEAANSLGLPVIENINTPIEPYRSEAVMKYVYVSDYVRTVFGDADSRHVTIYPGSDFNLFRRGKNDHAPDNCVGMVYRLECDKLNEEAILPFIRIVQLRPQTRILIVGGGTLLDSFQSATRAASVAANFEFTGYASYDELPELYRRMSLFVAPVWRESFGQVVPFAMSMKVPVVGYNVGAIGEIIGDDSLLAPATDVEHLARISVFLLDSPEQRRQIGESLQERAEGLFSVESMTRQYEQLYSEITSDVCKEPV